MFKQGESIDPRYSWKQIAKDKFDGLKAAQEKSCPMSSFLGLCEEGMVKYIQKGYYTRSISNKKYAVEGVRLLKEDPSLNETQLWNLIEKDDPNKKPNNQMNVVKALFDKGYIE